MTPRHPAHAPLAQRKEGCGNDDPLLHPLPPEIDARQIGSREKLIALAKSWPGPATQATPPPHAPPLSKEREERGASDNSHPLPAEIDARPSIRSSLMRPYCGSPASRSDGDQSITIRFTDEEMDLVRRALDAGRRIGGEIGWFCSRVVDRIGSTKETHRRRRRDAALADLDATYYHGLSPYAAARQILTELHRFRGEFRRIQMLPEQANSVAGTKSEILLTIMQNCGERRLPGAKRIEQILHSSRGNAVES